MRNFSHRSEVLTPRERACKDTERVLLRGRTELNKTGPTNTTLVIMSFTTPSEGTL